LSLFFISYKGVYKVEITILHIRHIERAFGFKLSEKQIDYLIKDAYMGQERGIGKTFVYCIKLALSDGEPLNLKKPEDFSDYGDGSVRYARQYFVKEFMDIREKLKAYGFPVRDVKK
jgi:hypothetical protein